MFKHNQDGAVNGVGVGLVLVSILLIGAIAFSVWAFAGRQDYKNNVDSKVASAVDQAKQAEDKLKDQQAAEAAKLPLRTYNGPETYGSMEVNFPRSWSAYIDDTGNNSNALVDGYFHPDVVPSITSQSSVFALRIRVVNQPYSQVLQSLNGLQSNHQATFSAYALPKLPKVVGIRVKGTMQVEQDSKTVDMVILPLRSDTLELWTEGDRFSADFNNNILPNFSFSP